MLELRTIRYFVTVAETEHVGRAAARLHLSQSPLSRQIRQLEEQLGLRLFERSNRRLHLTQEGRWLLDRGRELLARAERLEEEAAQVARGEVGTVVVGFVTSAMWSRLLPTALRRFRRSRPSAGIELRRMPSHLQVQALQRGDLDLALVHVAPPGPGFATTKLSTEPFLLALPADHPLARRRKVAARDLDGQPWIALPRERHPAAYDRFIAACARAGFTPDLRHEANDYETLLGLVEAGLGVGLLPASIRPAIRRPVALRELPWLALTTNLHLVRRVHGGSPLAEQLAAILRACAPLR